MKRTFFRNNVSHLGSGLKVYKNFVEEIKEIAEN